MKIRQMGFSLIAALGALLLGFSLQNDREQRDVSELRSQARIVPTPWILLPPRRDQDDESRRMAASPVSDPPRERRNGAVSGLEINDPALAVLRYPVGTADEASLARDLPPLVDRWAEKFPEEAAAWAEALPEGFARDLAAVTIANRRARTNPMYAGVWLKNFPGVEDMLYGPPAGAARLIP